MTLYNDFIETVKEIGHLPEVSVRRVVELTKKNTELEKRIAELEAQLQQQK